MSASLATAAVARQPQPSGQVSLATVSNYIAGLRALAVDARAATQLLAPKLDALVAHDANVLQLLQKFGYNAAKAAGGGGSFSHSLDLQGLALELFKYRYQWLAELGGGSYAVVYKARNRETGELIAVKKLRYNVEGNGFTDSSVREISILKELRHAHIVELKDIVLALNGSHVYLVLECMDCDLRKYLDTVTDASSIPRIKMVMHEILQAVHHAHVNLVMHRDLKPQNILVDKVTGHIKVTDFGLARQYLPPYKAYTEKVVTLYYRAPELLLGAPHYSTAIDLWSIGCILAEMANFEPLFSADSEIGLLLKVFETMGTPSEEQWTKIRDTQHFNAEFPRWPPRPLAAVVPRLAGDVDALDLLAGLLRYDPLKRLTAKQALDHPWFAEVRPPRRPAPPPRPVLLQMLPLPQCKHQQRHGQLPQAPSPSQRQQQQQSYMLQQTGRLLQPPPVQCPPQQQQQQQQEQSQQQQQQQARPGQLRVPAVQQPARPPLQQQRQQQQRPQQHEQQQQQQQPLKRVKQLQQ